VFSAKHHSHEQILPYYRNADVCLVTSLHDGMNLVAKEFRRGPEYGPRCAGSSVISPAHRMSWWTRCW